MAIEGCSSVPPLSPPSKGSIVVDYDVILKAQYTPGFDNTLDNIVSNLETKIKNATTVQVQDANNTCSGNVVVEGCTLRVSHSSPHPRETGGMLGKKAGGACGTLGSVSRAGACHSCLAPRQAWMGGHRAG